MSGVALEVGIRPRFPGPLARWRWLNESIPAERMAALRIAVALSLLLDILGTYLPYFSLFFAPENFGGRELSAPRYAEGHFYWSILRWLPDHSGPKLLMGAWLASALLLLIGWRPLISGLLAWACAVSFFNWSCGLNNSGDRLRNSLLIAVSVGCSGAVWGVSSVRGAGDPRPVLVPGWPAKMLFVQLAAMYLFSGYYKVTSESWQQGYAMYYVAHELSWCSAPSLLVWMPLSLHRLSSWGTLVWELAFPVFAVMPSTRAVWLALGAFFHAATLLTLEVGHFALYGLAAYAVFVPWERWFAGRPNPTPPLETV